MSEVSRYILGEPIGEFEDNPIYGGDCWSGMPAVYATRVEQTHARHAETEEEWSLFGAHLPNQVTVLFDRVISCRDFQALVAAGIEVTPCPSCPLMSE